MVKKPKVSIIIALYGYKFIANLEPVIKSIQWQTVDTEVILSEQGKEEDLNIKRIANKMKVKYVFSQADYVNGQIYYNIGRVRNVGASIAEGEYLYFNDADVLMINKIFLESIIKESKKHNDASMCRPSIYRLSESTTPAFIRYYMKCAEMNLDITNRNACFVDYLNGKLKADDQGEVFELIDDLPHVCTKYNYKKVINNKNFDYTKISEFIWTPTFHYGGSLFKQECFRAIGGYCELYYNWGLEDNDIHWKVQSAYKLCYIFEKMPELKLLHFEHKRNYNNATYVKNRKVFDQRVEEGVESAIIADRKNKSI